MDLVKVRPNSPLGDDDDDVVCILLKASAIMLFTTSEAIPPWHTFTSPMKTAATLMWMSRELEAMCTAVDVLSFWGTFLA